MMSKTRARSKSTEKGIPLGEIVTRPKKSKKQDSKVTKISKLRTKKSEPSDESSVSSSEEEQTLKTQGRALEDVEREQEDEESEVQPASTPKQSDLEFLQEHHPTLCQSLGDKPERTATHRRNILRFLDDDEPTLAMFLNSAIVNGNLVFHNFLKSFCAEDQDAVRRSASGVLGLLEWAGERRTSISASSQASSQATSSSTPSKEATFLKVNPAFAEAEKRWKQEKPTGEDERKRAISLRRILKKIYQETQHDMRNQTTVCYAARAFARNDNLFPTLCYPWETLMREPSTKINSYEEIVNFITERAQLEPIYLEMAARAEKSAMSPLPGDMWISFLERVSGEASEALVLAPDGLKPGYASLIRRHIASNLPSAVQSNGSLQAEINKDSTDIASFVAYVKESLTKAHIDHGARVSSARKSAPMHHEQTAASSSSGTQLTTADSTSNNNRRRRNRSKKQTNTHAAASTNPPPNVHGNGNAQRKAQPGDCRKHPGQKWAAGHPCYDDYNKAKSKYSLAGITRVSKSAEPTSPTRDEQGDRSTDAKSSEYWDTGAKGKDCNWIPYKWLAPRDLAKVDKLDTPMVIAVNNTPINVAGSVTIAGTKYYVSDDVGDIIYGQRLYNRYVKLTKKQIRALDQHHDEVLRYFDRLTAQGESTADVKGLKETRTWLAKLLEPDEWKRMRNSAAASSSDTSSLLEPVTIEIKEDFVAQRFKPHIRRLSPLKKQLAENTLRMMEAKGWIELVEEEFYHNDYDMEKYPLISVFFVGEAKGDGTARPLINYKFTLNEAAQDMDCTTLQPIDDILRLVSDEVYVYFSVIDVSQAFHQVPLVLSSRGYTLFYYERQLWRFCVLPQGFKNSPELFGLRLREILVKHDLRPEYGVFPYADDILVAGRSWQECAERTERVLRALAESALPVKSDKAELVKQEVSFLGRLISAAGIGTDPKRLQGLNDIKLPTTIKQMERFLGLANYQRKFIKNMADMQAILTALVTGARSEKRWKLDWSDTAREAYYNLLEAMKTDIRLAPFNPLKKLVLETDASERAAGAVLWCDGRVVAYASKVFPPAMRKAGSPKREFWAATWAMQHFGKYLEHRPFVWRTDAKVVIEALEKETILPQMDVFLHYKPYVTMEHRPGEEIPGADALSRNVEAHTDQNEQIPARFKPVMMKGQDYLQVNGMSQPQSFVDKAIIDSVKRLQKKAKRDGGNAVIEVGKIVGSTKQVPVFRDLKSIGKVIATAHGPEHYGATHMYEILRDKVIIRQLKARCVEHVSSCLICEINCDQEGINSSNETIKTTKPDQIWSADLIYLSRANIADKSSILLMTDLFSRFSWAAPLKDRSAEVTINAIEDIIYSESRTPEQMILDLGTNFESWDTRNAMSEFGINLVFSSTHHHESNGAAERRIRHFKNTLRKLVNPTSETDPDRWIKYVRRTAAIMNNQYCRSIGNFPVVLYRGAPSMAEVLASKFQMDGSEAAHEVAEMIREDAEHFDQQSRQHSRRPTKENPLQIGEWVSIENHDKTMLQPRRIGPYKVVGKGNNPKVVRLADRFGREKRNSYNENLLRRWPGHSCAILECEICSKFDPPRQGPQRQSTRNAASVTALLKPLKIAERSVEVRSVVPSAGNVYYLVRQINKDGQPRKNAKEFWVHDTMCPMQAKSAWMQLSADERAARQKTSTETYTKLVNDLNAYLAKQEREEDDKDLPPSGNPSE